MLGEFFLTSFIFIVVICLRSMPSMDISPVKTYVFSFGVLVLEIVSGKKNKDFCNSGQCLNLLGYVSINIDIPLFQWY